MKLKISTESSYFADNVLVEMITNQITSLLVVELTTEPNPNKFLESKIFSVGVLSNYYGAQNKPGLALLSFNTIIPHGLHSGAKSLLK